MSVFSSIGSFSVNGIHALPAPESDLGLDLCGILSSLVLWVLEAGFGPEEVISIILWAFGKGNNRELFHALNLIPWDVAPAT